jgi:RNA polymerase primary sigma factor
MSHTCAKREGVSSSLQVYLREINDESLLTATEECTLAQAIAQGDSQARTRMIQANLRLVVKIAREFVGRGMILEDLIGEGNLGLIRATEEFEPCFGTRFSTYASYWIKQAIRHALVNTAATIRLPAHMVGLLSKWRRAERALLREQGHSPSFSDVAAFLGLSQSQQTMVLQARLARQLKVESTVTQDSSRWPRGNSWDQYEPPEAVLEADDERLALSRRMERLDPRERAVLRLRYGLDGEPPLTLKEIGRRLGVTREWARKIELRAVRKLNYGADVGRSGPRRKPRRASAVARVGSRCALSRQREAPCRPRSRNDPIDLDHQSGHC